ncbi:hypothetical protein OVS_03220 [Mycoplasma ovis str. Michigan]|uniref:Uncharacterized protein n=1 Tax=Mycoplasma ovis str. Michigan TaxID=1415773 RepID=A0ABM5P1U4_9MOLU|nr:hypothetical protein OVS_03220 [Mycoplasma ovis str. Michigan]
MLTIPLVGLGGASALIPLSFSNSSNRLSIYEKIKKLGGIAKKLSQEKMERATIVLEYWLFV